MKFSGVMRIIMLTAAIVGISLLHYFTPLHLPMLHDIFQRLYYLPIILAAFWFGLRGGMLTSIVVSLLYVPHIIFQWGDQPSLELEKYLELVLYNVVGGITGFLSQREEQRRVELQQSALGLEESFKRLQSQTDLIIRIEEQLRRAERMSALGELSTVLAHEIRNPLGSIKGTAEILRDDYRPGDKKYEFLEILIKEADRLNRVMEDFLGLARPLPVERELIDLQTEIGEVLTLVSQEAAGRGISLQIVSGKGTAVHGDRERLRQVFLNIILNGIHATGRGGSLIVSTRQVPVGDSGAPGVEVSFADTGSGIDADDLPRIFEPFYTTKSGGTGLGLAIAQRIVESHGGTIDVESIPGKGTTFKVRLPV